MHGIHVSLLELLRGRMRRTVLAVIKAVIGRVRCRLLMSKESASPPAWAASVSLVGGTYSPMSSPTLDGPNLIGIFLGSILYGTFMAMSVHLLWRWWRREIRVPTFLLLASVALLLSTTAFTVVFMDYLYEGFVTYRDTIGPVMYFAEDRWQETTISAFNIFEQALADGILVYRCWLIWNKSKFILFITALPYISSILFSCIALAAASPSGELFNMFKSTFATWVHIWTGVSLGQNALTYLLIIGRIWYTARQSTSAFGKTSFTPVIIRLLSMGCMYLLLITLLLVANLHSSGGYVVICHIWSPVSGIVFLSLIVPTKRLSKSNLDHELLQSPRSGTARRTLTLSGSTVQEDGVTSVPSEFKVPDVEEFV
ncbi:hypothetical protein DACRYDRAFT_112432 [Dacryopinax primogenitus]|uniref:Uncharacterized protein n=1 Tax=Dacryopinax primogenitus (strain DJM 731) TaxID=1858805 RepID=M5FN47_DACPD|nr:uncharacterized protein DACRYDRAFT_112432 [Dacryopinax primogenitus]EJT96815.1 hypothetical protein DACRYDRAFT_112432 [Dacryopinax primogenitus]